MTIYCIEPDFRYQQLDLRHEDFWDNFPEEFSLSEVTRFSRLNLVLGSFWPKMTTGLKEIEGQENLVPDISHCLDGELLLSPAAYRYVGDLMRPYGEFLPIWIEGEEWQIFNCLTVAELITEETTDNKTVFDPGSVGNKLIFKCVAGIHFGVYCQDRFKKLIEDYGLSGTQLTSSSSGFVKEFSREINLGSE